MSTNAYEQAPALPGMPEPPPLIVEWWGEDSQFAIAQGHRDKEQFLALVLKEAGLGPGDTDLCAGDVDHRYWRDSRPSDGEHEEGWKTWKDVPAHEGEPITFLDLEP